MPTPSELLPAPASFERLTGALLEASRPLRVPGQGTQRIISATDVGRIAQLCGVPRWRADAAALESGVTPLAYLKNLSTYGVSGQVKLLEASVAVLGRHAAVGRALELLAGNGVGRVTVLSLDDPRGLDMLAAARIEQWMDAARGRNGSTLFETRTLSLRTGNPAAALDGLHAVAACLDTAADEQLLQFACRVRRIPCVLTGVEGPRAQCTTVLPGDLGTALVYKPTHPHLEADRAGEEAHPHTALLAGTWMAEQLTRLILGNTDITRGRLLYADLDAGEISGYPI